MRLRFKTMLGFIFLLIIISGIIGVGYLFYNEITTDADIVVDGDITINYLSGKSFVLNGDNEISFSVTNNSDDEEYYYIQLTDVYATDVSYELTSSNDLEITNTLKSDIISSLVSINSKETINYTLKFITTSNEAYRGTIEVGVRSNEEEDFATVILSNTQVSDTLLTSIGESSTLDEGLFAFNVEDEGISYYFRGAVVNNNVSFAGFNWKIVTINTDGSVKLVLDGILDEISEYYDVVTTFTESTIYEALNTWYDTYLGDYSDYIAYYKYCNDYVFESDGITYIAYNRIITNMIPTLVCLGSSNNDKIGLLTADEVMLAGGSTSKNTSYYLYNGDIDTAYYTMTSAIQSNGIYYPFVVDTDGSLVTDVSGTLLRGIRPVINIIKTAKVTGTGTIDDPYIISIQ